MQDLCAYWKFVGQRLGQDEEGTNGVARVEGLLTTCVETVEVAEQEKGWVMKGSCLEVEVMEKEAVKGGGLAPVEILMWEPFLLNQILWDRRQHVGVHL